MKSTKRLPSIRTLWIAAALVLLTPQFALADAESDYQAAKKGYLRITTSKTLKKYRDQWDRVRDRFEKVHKKHPRSARAADALYMLGQLYENVYRVSYLKSDLDRAIEYYEALAQRYPKNRLADDAVYFTGKIYEKRNRKADAYLAYDRVVREFPKGDFRPLAETKRAGLAAYKPHPKAKPKPKKRRTNLVLDLDYTSDEDSTKVIVDLEEESDFEKHRLGADKKTGRGERIYIDLLDCRLPPGFPNQKAINDGLVQSLRVAQNSPQRVRLVLDLNKLSDYDLYPLQLEDRWRLILQVYGEPASKAPPPSGPDPRAKNLDLDEIAKLLSGDIAPPDEEDEEILIEPPEGELSLYQVLGVNRVRKIAIDAGHGGKDPGAVSQSGLKEKTITLAIAKKVAKRLEEKGYETYMVRNDDRFIQLDFRVQLAKKAGADLFVSIHTNAARSRKAKGIETYFLDPRAKDRSSLETAAFENAMSLESLSEVEYILRDMGRTARQQESRSFAERVQKSLIENLRKKYKVKDKGVKGAPFRVLVGAQMPSILIEAAFITNPDEEKRLRSEKYQSALADAVADGVARYAEGMRLAKKAK